MYVDVTLNSRTKFEIIIRIFNYELDLCEVFLISIRQSQLPRQKFQWIFSNFKSCILHLPF